MTGSLLRFALETMPLKVYLRRRNVVAACCREQARSLGPCATLLTWILLGWATGSAGAGITAAANQGRLAGDFPMVTTDSLDKQRVTLPTDLEGQANLLLLSFARDQVNQIESWTAAAQALQHTNVSFRAYRLPVAERENAVFRWWANASLRSDETDPELWHWVVPIYVDKEPFRAQLGIADEKSVVALLVDKRGRVLWRATGASSAESRGSLMAAVANVSAPKNR